jgi:hypothetical protein
VSTEELSPQEKTIVEVVRLNKAIPRKEVRREGHLFGWRFVYNRRSKDNLWGRFGGGMELGAWFPSRWPHGDRQSARGQRPD